MATVLQSTCPKCQKTLRFPAEWLNQPIRCKHCGQMFQARVQESSGKNGPSGTSPSAGRVPVPPPLPRNAPKPPPPVSDIPNPGPGKINSSTAASPPGGRHSGIRVTENRGNDPFEDLHGLESAPSQGRVSSNPKRKKQSSYLPLVLVSLFLLVGSLGAGLGFLYLKNNPSPVTKNDPTPGTDLKNATPKEKPADKLKDHSPDKSTDSPLPTSSGTPFPRRALIISIHNYLYANHVHGGPQGEGHLNIASFQRALNNALRIPLPQILHLSDEAVKGKKRAPLKSVIEQTVHQFLQESRPQDRVILFFIGHGVEIDGKCFLAPIEGELDLPATLIPLEWFYEELKQCPARQKVFVVDIARYSPTYGRERPDGGPMNVKFDAQLQKPPEGVQVVSACSAEQQSYETDYDPMGVFLTSFYTRVSTNPDRKPSKTPGALEGTISRPTDSFPLARVLEAVNKQMVEDLKGTKLTQVAKLYGTEKTDGAPYDPKEPLAKVPTLPPSQDQGQNKESLKLVKDVLEEISVPAVKVSEEDNSLRLDLLPSFEASKMAKMMQSGSNEPSNLRKAILQARAILWAISPDTTNLPASLASEVKKIKGSLGVNLKVLREGYTAPAAGNQENAFKKGIENDEREVAKMIGSLGEILEMLDEVAADRDQESPRWQANFDFIRSRVQAQIAYLTEYQSMLGAMRKEFPERDANLYNGWRLASQTQLTGDSSGKKLAGASQKTMEKLAKQFVGTPWEVLAKREKLAALGLEWKPANIHR